MLNNAAQPWRCPDPYAMIRLPVVSGPDRDFSDCPTRPVGSSHMGRLSEVPLDEDAATSLADRVVQ